MIQNTTLPAAIQPAEQPSDFVSSLKARKDRYDRCCEMANELSIAKPHPFAGDETFAEIEAAYAQHEADYAAWLDARNGELEEATSSINADLDSALASPVSFAADHTDDQPSRTYRPELIEEAHRRRVYRDSDGKRYTEW